MCNRTAGKNKKKWKVYGKHRHGLVWMDASLHCSVSHLLGSGPCLAVNHQKEKTTKYSWYYCNGWWHFIVAVKLCIRREDVFIALHQRSGFCMRRGVCVRVQNPSSLLLGWLCP